MKPAHEIIATRYKVISELGAGSIGVVYKCRDLVMDNLVALKLLLNIDSMDGARRFHLEAKVTAKLDHPNIVKILDFGEEEGQLYIVLELVEGTSLESINENEKIEFEIAISIFIQTARALAYANKHNVLHRDLKPSNIIITRDNQVKIVDFGLAKVNTENQSITKTGMAIGTPAYMSPEAALGDKLDIRSDIFSMGCIMYETLTGQLPFNADSSMTQMLVRTNQEAPALNSDENPIFPEEIAYIVDRCLLSKPDKRFQSFDEIERLLVNFQALYDAEPEPVTTPGESEKSDAELPTIREAKSSLSKLFMVGTILVICMITYPLISKVTKPQKRQTKAFKKEADVFSALQAEDLEIEVKTKVLEGKLWHSLWGMSYTKDLDRLKSFDKIEHLILLEGNLVGVESSRICDFNLKSLDFKLSLISDQTLQNVGKVSSLELLRLDKVHGIKPSGFKYLTRLRNLEELSIRNTDISDDIIPYIAKFKSLRILHLSDCKNLTGKNIDLLANLPVLEKLYLDGSNLSSPYLQNLEKLGNLDFLYMRRSGITNGKLKEIEDLKVKFLDIKGNPFTPEVWQCFSKMKNLRHLYLSFKKSKVTNSQKDKLKNSLPNCTIHFSSK